MIRKVRINELLSISGTPRTAFPTRNHYVLQIRHDKQTAGASPRPTHKVTFCGASFIFAKNGRPHRVAPTFICRRHTSFFKRANAVCPYRVDDNYCCFHGTAELFKFNNRFGRERRPRRSVGFDVFSRTSARLRLFFNL